MNDSSINTFGGGMNCDISKGLIPENTYPYAQNFRLISDHNGESFELQNIRGNKYVLTFPSVTNVYKITLLLGRSSVAGLTIAVKFHSAKGSYDVKFTGTDRNTFLKQISDKLNYYGFKASYTNKHVVFTHETSTIIHVSLSDTTNFQLTEVFWGTRSFSPPRIIGYCELRDEVYIFTCVQTINNGQIWHFKDDTLTLLYNNKLNLSTSYPIQAIGYYNSDTNKRVYFWDGNNNLRVFNAADTNLFALDPEQMEIVPQVSLEIPRVTGIGSGNLYNGVIQYAYCLYKNHGQQSRYSDVTPLIKLSDKSLSSSTDMDYGGGDLDVSSGKSVNIRIDNLDKDFDNIRIVSLFYDKLFDSPKITIVYEGAVPLSGSVYFTDGGNINLGSYTLEEFNTIGSFIFSPKTVEHKNNLLVATNYTEEYFDLEDYDARAYRWYKAPAEDTYKALVQDSAGNQTYLTSYTVDDEADVIQTKTIQATYKYNKDSGNVGGSGENISYEFAVVETSIDDATDNNTFYVNTSNQIWSALSSDFNVVTGYSGYSNPLNTFVGYQRDEIYSFALVALDEYGRQSFAKWIGDIKFPAQSDSGYSIFTSANKANILYIKFTIKNYPLDLNGNPYRVKIVRCKRNDEDKSIIAQGLLLQTRESFGKRYPVKLRYEYYQSPTIHNLDSGLLFVSPETLLYETQSKEQQVKVNDYLRLGMLHDLTCYSYHSNKSIFKSKYSSQTGAATYNISAVSLLGDGEEKIIGTKTFSNKHITGTDTICKNGTKLGIIADGLSLPSLLRPSINQWKVYIANVERTLSTYYKGLSYHERINREYIDCFQGNNGDIIHVFGGDTYICYFDYLYKYLNTDESWDDANYTFEVIYFPVETTIPLNYRTDYPFHTSKGRSDKLQEKAGFYTDNTSSYTQEKDLYLINTVYLKEDEVRKYQPKPLNFEFIKTYDTRTIVSERKVLNEETDSWCTFKVQNFLDLLPQYGPVNCLVNHKNNVFAFQDKAVGVLSIDERALIPDNNVSALVLGTGTVLQRCDYINTLSGSKHKYSVKSANKGLYYYDELNEGICMVNAETFVVSDVKGIRTHINELALGDNPHVSGINCYYDKKHRELVYNFSTFCVSINELIGSYQSFYTLSSPQYIEFGKKVYAVYRDESDQLYLNNEGIYGKFFGQSQNSLIRTISNKNFMGTKIFDNHEVYLDSRDEDINNSYDFFSSVRIWNDYQYTGNLSLAYGTADSDGSHKFTRRNRTYTFFIPRNAVNVKASENKDIFGNTDSSRLFKERMRDKYLCTELTYTNNKRITVSFIITNFRYIST